MDRALLRGDHHRLEDAGAGLDCLQRPLVAVPRKFQKNVRQRKHLHEQIRRVFFGERIAHSELALVPKITEHEAKNTEHIDVGYNSNQTAVVARQIATMMALGGYGMLVNWYGSTNHARSFFLDTTNVVAQYLSSCFSTTCPFQMGIIEDKGAFSAQCPKGKKDQTSCITKNMNEDMDYINRHLCQSTLVYRRGYKSDCSFFLHEPDWPGSDWNRIWSEVKAHTRSYKRPFKFVFEEEDAKCWRRGG